MTWRCVKILQFSEAKKIKGTYFQNLFIKVLSEHSRMHLLPFGRRKLKTYVYFFYFLNILLKERPPDHDKRHFISVPIYLCRVTIVIFFQALDTKGTAGSNSAQVLFFVQSLVFILHIDVAH